MGMRRGGRDGFGKIGRVRLSASFEEKYNKESNPGYAEFHIFWWVICNLSKKKNKNQSKESFKQMERKEREMIL